MARRIDWDKVRRWRKAWQRRPWEDYHQFWRGYELHPRAKKTPKKIPNESTKLASPRENKALVRCDFPFDIAMQVPSFSETKYIGGKFKTPLITFSVRVLDYICPNLPEEVRIRLLHTFREIPTNKDRTENAVVFEKRLQVLSFLDSWRYDHLSKHLELHFVPRKAVYRSASIIWPDLDPK
jgi:hypothetical protein